MWSVHDARKTVKELFQITVGFAWQGWRTNRRGRAGKQKATVDISWRDV
ncbi:MAG: hypothetical protein ABSB22_11890 [Thermodesulfobacteriota bacterium]